MTSAPDGGTTSDSLLNFLAKAAAKYAGRSGDFKQESRSCQEWYKKCYGNHRK